MPSTAETSSAATNQISTDSNKLEKAMNMYLSNMMINPLIGTNTYLNSIHLSNSRDSSNTASPAENCTPFRDIDVKSPISFEDESTFANLNPLGMESLNFEIQSNSVGSSGCISTDVNRNPPDQHNFFDFKTMKPLKEVLKNLQLEASVACHVEYLVKQLYESNFNQSLQLKDGIGSYISIFNQALPSTPSAVFSASGILFTCNQSFSNLISVSIDQILSGQFCIFSVLDLASILSLLDMSTRYQNTQSNGFGRVTIETQNTIKNKKLCACSISTCVEADCMWIIGQFIPI